MKEPAPEGEDGQGQRARKPGDASRKAIAALLVKIDAVLGDTEPALLTKAES